MKSKAVGLSVYLTNRKKKKKRKKKKYIYIYIYISNQRVLTQLTPPPLISSK